MLAAANGPEQFNHIVSQLDLEGLATRYFEADGKIGALADEDLERAIDADASAVAEYREARSDMQQVIQALAAWAPTKRDNMLEEARLATFVDVPTLNRLQRWRQIRGKGGRINYDEADFEVFQAIGNLPSRLRGHNELRAVASGDIPGVTFGWVDSYSEYVRRVQSFTVPQDGVYSRDTKDGIHAAPEVQPSVVPKDGKAKQLQNPTGASGRRNIVF